MIFTVETPHRPGEGKLFTEMQFWVYDNCPSFIEVKFSMPPQEWTSTPHAAYLWTFSTVADAEIFQMWSVLKWT
jgi:hypothetical protein